MDEFIEKEKEEGALLSENTGSPVMPDEETAPAEEKSGEKDFEPFPGTVYSASGKPVNMPPEEEEEDPPKAEKNGKKALRILAFALVCVLVSAATSAVTSYTVTKKLTAHTEETTVPEQSLSDEIIFEEPQTILVTEETAAQTTEEETETETAAQTETLPTEPETVTEPVTEPPAKTKSQIYKESVNSVVSITSVYDKVLTGLFGTTFTRQYGSAGSGFFVSNDGYIVTNYHVVENGTDITVSTYSGETYKARTVGYDAANDVAVLKIDAAGQSVWLGDSSAMSVGDDIMVIGNALGSLSYTFTDGVISFKNRKVAVEGTQEINMFQTNAAINNGNSGGPVYNMDGEVIGIASAKFSSESIEGLCFFIPINDVREKIFGFIG